MLAAFKNNVSPLPNMLALSFAIVGYVLGVAMLFSHYWIVNFVGVLLTAQALIISAYLLHEFSHWSIFNKPQILHYKHVRLQLFCEEVRN